MGDHVGIPGVVLLPILLNISFGIEGVVLLPILLNISFGIDFRYNCTFLNGVAGTVLHIRRFPQPRNEMEGRFSRGCGKPRPSNVQRFYFYYTGRVVADDDESI